MRVALLGDVHANLPALEAVLAHAREQGAEDLWNLGDFVGYHAFPDEVVESLRQAGAVSIVGNYDLKVLKFPRKDAKWRRKKRPEKWLAFKWAWEQLTPGSRDYLGTLPRECRLTVAGWRVLLTHGSPASIDEHLFPDTPDERLAALAEMARADLVACAHSHQPFNRQVAGVRFVNSGSVGRPDDGDPRASYALLDLVPGRLAVRHFRLAYDVERAVDGLRRAGLPALFEEMARRGLSLDGVLADDRRL